MPRIFFIKGKCIMLKYQEKSLYQYCKEKKLNYYTIRRRIHVLGMSIEKAINAKSQTHLFYEGKSLLQYCKEKKLNYYTIKYRIENLGLSVEEAINYISKKGKYHYEGKNLHAWCKENGVNYNTVKSRIRELGLSVEDAVNYNTNRHSRKDIKDWCKENGYKFSSIIYKIKTYGLTKEQAASWGRKYCYEIENESLYDYLLKKGWGKRAYSTIRKYVVDKNLSVEDAFNLWVNKHNVEV